MSTIDWIVRGSAWLALALFALGLAQRHRGAWSLGCLVFWLHVAAAFHLVHGWSHTDAVAATARQTRELVGIDAGAGVWANYAFGLVWLADAAAWWWCGQRYDRRPHWLAIVVNGYLGFLALCATVPFGRGATPVVAMGVCGLLLAGWWRNQDLRRVSRERGDKIVE